MVRPAIASFTVVLLLCLLGLPARAASTGRASVEVLATEDEVATTALVSEGYDILDVSVGTAWHEDDAYVFIHIELARDLRAGGPTADRPWRIEVEAPIFEPGFALVTRDGTTWEDAREDARPFRAIDVQVEDARVHIWRAFIPNALSPGPGVAWDSPTVRSLAGGDLRDAAPGGVWTVIGPGLTTPDFQASQRRGVLEARPVAPLASDYFADVRAIRDGDTITLSLRNPLNGTQHVRLLNASSPAWTITAPTEAIVMGPGGMANVMFTAMKHDPCCYADLYLRSDEGGNLWMTYGPTGDLSLQPQGVKDDSGISLLQPTPRGSRPSDSTTTLAVILGLGALACAHRRGLR